MVDVAEVSAPAISWRRLGPDVPYGSPDTVPDSPECDLCSRGLEALAWFSLDEFEIDVPGNPLWLSGTRYYTCRACAMLVDQGEWDRIFETRNPFPPHEKAKRTAFRTILEGLSSCLTGGPFPVPGAEDQIAGVTWLTAPSGFDARWPVSRHDCELCPDHLAASSWWRVGEYMVMSDGAGGDQLWWSGPAVYTCPDCTEAVADVERWPELIRPWAQRQGPEVIRAVLDGFGANVVSGPHLMPPPETAPTNIRPTVVGGDEEARTLWTGIQPRTQLWPLRDKMLRYRLSPAALQHNGIALLGGGGTLRPAVNGGVFAMAKVLNMQEADRLAQCQPYWANKDMTAVGLRRSQRLVDKYRAAVKQAEKARAAGGPAPEPWTPPRFDIRRVPGWADEQHPHKHGFIVFDSPLGSYEGRDGSLVVIVAASWGPWTPDFAPVDIDPDPNLYAMTGRRGPGWYTQNQVDPTAPAAVMGDEGDPEMVWVTLYSLNLDDPAQPLLLWDNEAVLVDGSWTPVAADEHNTASFTGALVGCWEAMTQHLIDEKYRLTQTETVPRKPSEGRRDRRRGITGPVDVKLVSIYADARKARPASTRGGRAKVQRNWTCSWMVGEHERNQCPNPRAHPDNPDCADQHYRITILEHPVNPAGLPFKETRKVLAWTREPKGEPL